MLSRVLLFVTPWTAAHQAPLRSGLPFPASGDLPDPGPEPATLVAPALADRFFTT